MSALTPTQTLELLNKLGHTPQKKLGQNFLIDGNIVRKSLSMADIQKGDSVVEVGPGLGTLTGALLASGSCVYAVEKDPTLAKHLEETLKCEYETFDLLEGDAIQSPRAGYQNPASFKIVANLPYAISTPWMDLILQGPLPETMVLMLQKEAADRLTAAPNSKHYGAISIFLEAAFKRSGAYKVPRQSFYPVPGVDSVLLHLTKKPAPHIFEATTRAIIRECFTQRRKQIGSLPKRIPDYKDALENWLQTMNISKEARPENIKESDWQALDAIVAKA